MRLVITLFALTGPVGSLAAQPLGIKDLDVPAQLTPSQFADYLALVKPGPDESPWAKIAWHASVWEARKQAAAEGKPILIWSGGGSPPLGAC